MTVDIIVLVETLLELGAEVTWASSSIFSTQVNEEIIFARKLDVILHRLYIMYCRLVCMNSASVAWRKRYTLLRESFIVYH